MTYFIHHAIVTHMSEQFTSHNDTNPNDKKQDIGLSDGQEPPATTTDSDRKTDITTVGTTLEGKYLNSGCKLAIDSPYFLKLLEIEDEVESDSDKQA